MYRNLPSLTWLLTLSLSALFATPVNAQLEIRKQKLQQLRPMTDLRSNVETSRYSALMGTPLLSDRVEQPSATPVFRRFNSTDRTTPVDDYAQVQRAPPTSQQGMPLPLDPALLSIGPGQASPCQASQQRLVSMEQRIGKDESRRPKAEVNHLGNPGAFGDIWPLTNPEIRTELVEYRQAVQSFVQNCLMEVREADSKLQDERLNATVGVLTIQAAGGNSSVYCTAFRVARNRIATAKHCLDQDSLKAMSLGTFHFNLPLRSQSRPIKVKGETCIMAGTQNLSGCAEFLEAVASEGLASDFVLLELDTHNVSTPHLPWFKSNLSAATLTVVAWIGYPAFVDMADKALDGKLAGQTSLGAMRLPRGEVCPVAATTDVCILHGCHSTPGSSGAPVIAWNSDGQLGIAGIHIAALSGVDMSDPWFNRCQANKANLNGEYLGNVAITIPTTLVQLSNQTP